LGQSSELKTYLDPNNKVVC